MALIFGRFDKADEKVREAIIALSQPNDKDKELGDPCRPYIGPARIIFDCALEHQPNVKMKDLESVVAELAREAKSLGHFGRHFKEYLLRVRYQAGIYNRFNDNGSPFDEDQTKTLEEWAVLMQATFDKKLVGKIISNEYATPLD